MKTPTLGIIFTMEFFYCESGIYYHLQYEQPKKEISFADFELLTQQFNQTNQKYMIIYDHLLALTKDKWDALPTQIDLNYLELYYQMGIFSEEDYMKYRLLYSEKNSHL
ncbi:hypothetical protein [Paenibacillus sp. FSL L8-0709]|uniref:hypothetical protein n=1 Tax=Paenibacillus sp. FSL L8-0709 TaxID=2975312 RepID=UPI0030F9FF3E